MRLGEGKIKGLSCLLIGTEKRRSEMGLDMFPDDSAVYLCVCIRIWHVPLYCNGLAHSKHWEHVFMCESAMIDEVEKNWDGSCFNTSLLQMSPQKILHLITIRTLPALPSHSSEACGVQTGRAFVWRNCWLAGFVGGDWLCQIPLGHSSSEPTEPHRFPSLRARVRARTRQRCVLVYLRVRPCLQQLSEIIRLYHVMPHVGIFPAVPERLFCFLRLASARRNAAY